MAQMERDLFSFNYTLSPAGSDDVQLEYIGLRLNFPMPLKKGVLVHSLSYENMRSESSIGHWQHEDLENYHGVNYALSYMYPINDSWRLITRAGIIASSNFVGSLSGDDLRFNGNAIAVNTKRDAETMRQWTFGLAYTAITGEARVIPVVRFYKKINASWSYALGFPETFVQYQFNTNSALKLGARMQGFYANLSHGIPSATGQTAQAASFRSGRIGLEYSHKMDEIWTLVFRGDYALYNNYRLLDASDQEVYDYELDTQPYFSVGLKLNLLNNLNHKRHDKNK